MKTQHRHLIILFSLIACLMGVRTEAWAADWTNTTLAAGTYVLTTSGSGFKVNGGTTVYTGIGDITAAGTVTIEFQTSKTVTLNGLIKADGKRINIKKTSGTVSPTIKRGSRTGAMFYALNGGSLYFTGVSSDADKNRLIIDGGATYQTAGDARTTCTAAGSKGQIVRCDYAVLSMSHVKIQNGYSEGIGCAIFLKNEDNAIRNATLTDVKIQGCFSTTGGPAMYLQGPDWHNVTCTRVEILYCNTSNSPGYTIRANGPTKSNLTLNACEIHHNKAKAGAGLGWNCAGDGANSICIIKGTTKIHHNEATSYGGGIVGETNLDIQSAEIYNNTAPEGAGIYLKQWGGDAGAVNGSGFSVSLGSNVKIYNNTATGTGGGIYYHLDNSNATGFNTSSNPIAASFSLTINGAEIYGNSANKGAGIAMYDPLAKRHYNSAISMWSGVISRSVSITSGSIHDNISTGDSGKYGAGIYIRKVQSSDAEYVTDYGGSTSGGGTLTFTASGGSIYQNGVSNGTVNAGYGGGIFITHDFTTTSYNSVCQVNIQGSTSIYANQCTTNGGAIYLKNADFSMTGGTIGGSTANANKAGGSGGGFFITGDKSKVTVSGGNITYNTATNNGGGFYVAQTGTDGTSITGSAKVTNNKAKSGGGAYINDGTLTVNGSNVEIKSNEATAGNGGGIFANGGTVTLTAGTLSNNVATGSGTTGLGGGIYSQGALTIKGATIGGTATSAKNTAYDGAGVYVAGGTVSHTSGSVRFNEASHHGGGVYSTAGTVTINGANALIADNQATYQGGGIWAGGTVNLQNGQIKRNKTTDTSSGSGGGVYVDNNTFNMTGGTIGGATADANTVPFQGGGVYVTGESAKVVVQSGTISYNTATGSSGDGGGIYVNETGSDGTSIKSSSVVSYNKAKHDGGGVYVASGKVSVNASTLQGNEAETGVGGGIYAGGNVTIEGASYVKGNTAETDGGGIYVNNGTFTMKAGTIGGSASDKNTATSGNGGGVYVTGASAKVEIGSSGNTATISYNEATSGDGGGVYVNQTGSAGTTIQNAAQVSYNKAINGGGVFVKSGTITVKTNSTLTNNTATGNGGGIYANGGTVNVSASTTTTEILKENSAYEGGAIYANGGTVNFSNGVIKNNYASHHGGGLYIPATGKLTLKGTAKITRNHVPDNMHGGGVYLAGVVEVGTPSAKASSDVLTVEDNFAATTNAPLSYTITDDTRNNIYLPQPVAVPVGSSEPHKDVITIFEDGMDLNNTSVGFSVPRNFVPVIYCNSASYLAGLVNSSGILEDDYIFEDSQKYTVYYHTYAPYDPNHLYLSGGTWVDHVTSQPAGFSVTSGNVTISSNEGLAWLISYVNGLNDVEGGAHSMAGNTVTLTADVDMGDYAWVPIGSMLHSDAFQGTFEGNGHTVDNLYCMFLGAETGASIGMFGAVNGNAVIKDVFLQNATITTMDQTTGTHIMGCIAETLGGSAKIYNCGAEGSIISLAPGSIIGGLVGQVTSASAEIHSSYAAAKMTGSTMGGLVGQITAGDLYNSFANPQFTYNGPAYTDPEDPSTAYHLYVGGLVGENRGTIANCYVRLERAQSLGSALFGMLAGSNTYTIGDTPANGTISYCYAPDGTSTQFNHSYPYLYNGVTTGLSNYDLYKKVDAPYLYNRSNDNLVGSTGKTLTEKLNAWVSAKGTNTDYAFWKRTTAGGYSTSAHAGNINDDYPIHKMKGLACVGSTDGIFMEYKYSLNELIRKYNGFDEEEDPDDFTLWLYAAPLTAMTASGATPSYESVSQQNYDFVKLYIDEDATLLQANGNVLKAFTSQTLGDFTSGRGERWHYCSSSLQQSAIGFSYGADNVGFNWDPNPCSVTFSTANDAAVFPGDLTSGDIARVDLYAFYEPEYHWINLKRNTNSHWHMNATTVPIVYNGNGTGGNGNETYLVPGKGYLMSIDQEQLLQNWGQLNNGQVTLQDVTYTEANAWAGLLGYNVLGNPYQSYLDFNAFITNSSNAALFASKDAKEITYATYEPRYGAYVQYKSGSSVGSKSGDGLIHAHQGFLIRRGGGSANANAIFTNDMRSVSGTSPFRSEQPAFPLINLTLTDGVGNADIAVVELGRERNEGVEKLRVGDCGARISLALDHEEYAILFRDEVVDYQALHLEAQTEGTYTLTWETANGEFEALTLVDNITGTTTDMLTRDSYTFEANPDQYASRFKIVIGDYKDIEENEGGASTGSATAIFAYYANGEIHLAETYHGASLQIVDVTGRVIVNRDGVHAVSTNGIAPGVYLLRLTDGNGTKVQKMVIE